jgi:2-polyprenyl-3-methyl-5-hydroxy-6-metoxy-1,4-benzoquinol methylase
MITKDVVRIAYQLFLGREPENGDVVNNLIQNVHSLNELREQFLKSPEFIKQVDEFFSLNHTVSQRHPYHLPFIPVETEVANVSSLKEMFERAITTWESLGKSEPYWSVVTQPQYLSNDFEEHSEEFYRSGNYSCQLLITALRRNRINLVDLKVCLEVGCGVGRVTANLAENFKNVFASDISTTHLKVAQNYLNNVNIVNVQFLHWSCLDDIKETPEIDAIFSLITFQHNPPPLTLSIIEILLNKLRPGGVAFFQVPTYKTGYIFEINRYLNSEISNSMEMHFIPQRELFKIIQNSECICLEIREDEMIGDVANSLSNTFLIQKLLRK